MDGSTNPTTPISGTGAGIIGGLVDAGNMIKDIIYQEKWLEQAEENYELQKDFFKYSKDLQQQIFEREDNAVLRRVLDLKRAGLSPVLAAGSAAGSGPVVSTSAPQRQLANNVPDRNPVATALGMISMRQQIDKTEAENEYIKQQKEKTKADTNLTNVTAGIKAHDLKIMKDSGMSSNPSEFGKWAKDLVGAGQSNVLKSAIQGIKDKVTKPTSKPGSYSGGW